MPGHHKKVGKYTLTDQLGKGQFGVVYKAYSQDEPGKCYAVKSLVKKSISGNTILERLFNTEVSIMQKIRHDNIMPLYDFLETGNNYYLVMRLCSEGDFEHFMKKRGIKHFEEEEAVTFLKQIMNGFKELHRNKIMHRDFKLANIFVDAGPTLVIGDFGFAKSGTDLAQTNLGTPLTMAPEVLENKGTYTSTADLWSIGAVFWALLFGDYPFNAYDRAGLLRAIKAGSGSNLKVKRNINNISPEAEDLLKQLLTYDPKSRISWPAFFKHKLFDKHGSKADLMTQMIAGGMGSMSTLDAEFAKNRDQEHDTDTTTDFIDPLKYDGSKDIHKCEEQTDSGNTGKEIELKNCYDFYNHERKKVEFIFHTVKKLRDVSKLAPFKDYASLLYIISFLLAKKGLVLHYFNTESLKNKNDCFRLKCFMEFISSDFGNKALKEHDGDFQMYTSYSKYLLDISSNYTLDPTDIGIVMNMGSTLSVNLPDIDQLLLDRISSFNNFSSFDPNLTNDKNLKKSCLDIALCVGYSIKCQIFFPFHDQKGTVFDWHAFYGSLGYLDERAMMLKIKELNLIGRQ